jgi:hypothetical protein
MFSDGHLGISLEISHLRAPIRSLDRRIRSYGSLAS